VASSAGRNGVVLEDVQTYWVESASNGVGHPVNLPHDSGHLGAFEVEKCGRVPLWDHERVAEPRLSRR
jgi:hypothetical protein